MKPICAGAVLYTALAVIFGAIGGLCAEESPTYGPTNGTLIIVGGGSDRGAGILERFINKAGGVNSKFVIIPTGQGNRTADGQIKIYKEDDVLGVWKMRGLKNVRMLHTSDRQIANTEEFVKPLREANAVWIDGDKQQDLLDSYSNTLTQREFLKLLERGGVIGANAAGATCLGTYLVRGPDAGPGSAMLSEQSQEAGFALLRNCIIDLQVNTCHRWDDLVPVIKSHPDLLGISLSETTAIVVTGDRFEVVGKWKVAVHDATRAYHPWERPYYVFSPGDVFNMKTRKIERLGNGTQIPPPLDPTAQNNDPAAR
jgi:cyanophycinase